MGLDWVLTKSREEKKREDGRAGREYILARQAAGSRRTLAEVWLKLSDAERLFVMICLTTRTGGALPGCEESLKKHRVSL